MRSVRFADTYGRARTQRNKVRCFPNYRETMPPAPKTARRPSARQFEYTPSKTMVMRTSCEEIRAATRYFVDLLEISREFEKANTQTFVPPNFGKDLAELTTAFDAFSQQAVSHFSTIRKTPVTRQYGPVSLTYQRAEEFTRCWARYLETLRTVEVRGVAGYDPELRATFTTLFGMLSTIEGKLRAKGFWSRDVVQFINHSRNELYIIDGKLVEVMESSHQVAIATLKKRRCDQFLKEHITEMNVLLDRTLPRDILTPLEIAKLKFDVSVACANMSQIIGAVSVFDLQIGKMKDLALMLNTELTHVYEHLKLPFLTLAETAALVEEEMDGSSSCTSGK